MTKRAETNSHVMLNLVLNSIQYWFSIWFAFFLLSANAPFIPVHRTGFSDAVLVKYLAAELRGI
jgi:hypothetical protein